MAQKLNIFSGRQFIDASGNPYSGAQLFVYTAGSSTKATVTKDSAGISAHANPIILNARGEPADGSGASQAVWQAEGSTLKLVLAPSTDTDPPASAISSWDDLSGVNDTTTTIDQWVSGNTPTYVSATSFTLVGDQTSELQVGRRLKTTNTGGTIYSTIITSAYTSLTTITVVNDSSTLDSGLSAVSYGVLSSDNRSIPLDVVGADVASANALSLGVGDFFDVTGTTTVTSISAKGVGASVTLQFDGVLTLTHHTTDLILPGAANITTAAGDIAVFYEYAAGDWRCASYTPAGTTPVPAAGTWTPKIQDSSLSDGEGQTYSIQYGSYTRIGNRVLFSGKITMTSIGTLTAGDSAFIVGLPFTSSATTNADGGLNVTRASGVSKGSNDSNISGYIIPNVDRINLTLWNSSVQTNTFTVAHLTSSGSLTFHGQYITDS